MSDYRAQVDFGGDTWYPELSESEIEELKKHKPDCHYAIWLRGTDRSYNGVCDCKKARVSR